MRIIITGSTGLVGKRTVSLSLSHRYTVYTYGRSSDPCGEIAGHFSEPHELPKDCDLLIHCAAATPLNSSMAECPALNHRIDSDLVTIIRTSSPKQVVYLSTMAVYGHIIVEKVDELCAPSCPNPYGQSKLDGESLIQAECNAMGVPLTILRLPGVVDTGMATIFFKHVYDSIQAELPISVRNRKSAFNNAILADDVFNISLSASKMRLSSIINLHSSDSLSLETFLALFEEIAQKEAVIIEDLSCNPPFLISNSREIIPMVSALGYIVQTYHKRMLSV